MIIIRRRRAKGLELLYLDDDFASKSRPFILYPFIIIWLLLLFGRPTISFIGKEK